MLIGAICYVFCFNVAFFAVEFSPYWQLLLQVCNWIILRLWMFKLGGASFGSCRDSANLILWFIGCFFVWGSKFQQSYCLEYEGSVLIVLTIYSRSAPTPSYILVILHLNLYCCWTLSLSLLVLVLYVG